MELRSFIAVFTRQKNLFLLILGLPLVLALIFVMLAPTVYETTLTLTITREKTELPQQEELDDNTGATDAYDSFYRLSADEKFAQTLIAWFASPSVANDILSVGQVDTQKHSIADLQNTFRAVSLSPQIVEVSYKTSDAESATLQARAIINNLSEFTGNFAQVDNSSWFQILEEEPITREVKPNFILLIIGSLFIGLCLAILVTLLRHYYNEEQMQT